MSDPVASGSPAALEHGDLGLDVAECTDARIDIVLGDPDLMARVAAGGAFGGEYSRPAAQAMFNRHSAEAVTDVRAKTRIVELAPRSWLVRLPIVNSAVFETDAGLVVCDTGMAPGGPALLEAIRSVSEAPIHTIVYSHGHVDHAYGTWALMEDPATMAAGGPQIVAHRKVADRFDTYLRLRGSLARYMNQPPHHLPSSRDDLVWPTVTFDDRLELEIGGEALHLVHHPAETDDQCYAWMPDRGALYSADYYQGFLPNLGNGKRLQRGTDDWVIALREMADLGPTVLFPGHGEGITDPELIRSEFTLLADALEHIIDHVIDGLNRRMRKDLIVDTLDWPDRFADHPTLNVQYVTPRDIARMVIKRWTGWWDDIPSHWAPAPLTEQAATIVALAGGIDPLVERARSLLDTDLPQACHLADWAWYAEPHHPDVQQLVVDAYRDRIMDPSSNTQDILVYLDHAAAARALQRRAEDPADS